MITAGIQTITAQTSDNILVLPNSSWSVLHYGLESYNIPCCVSTQYVYFDGDSTVAGKTYKKVFSCNDELHENKTYEGLIREQDKKTFFLSKGLENEYLLYDFSLEEGMVFEYSSYMYPELTTVSLYVKTGDMIEINGSPRKRLQLSYLQSEDSWIIDTWIEGIGSLNGILQPCYRLFLVGGVRELLCHYKDDEQTYKNPAYSDCYYDKVEDITSTKRIIINGWSVYPNPVNNVLVISSPNETELFVEFTGISGKTVYAKQLGIGKEHTIDVSLFASGLYLLRAYDANGLASAFKIIKK
jgi:hypothetical protein